MNQERPPKKRRTFFWPKEAQALVRLHGKTALFQQHESLDNGLNSLVTKLAELTGNPRDACWRFARQRGMVGKRAYQPWTKAGQQRLLDLIAIKPLAEVASEIRRSPASVRSMLHRLGASARMGHDWFTKYTLAEALHVRADEVERWITLGWLRSRVVSAGGLRREIIEADDFSQFCKTHRRLIVGRRLNIDRLNFVRDFVFPPSHAELLAVRQSKKERAAYEEQVRGTLGPDQDDRNCDEDLAATA